MCKIDRKQLVDRLKAEGYIKSKTVEKAMLTVPRELFVPDFMKKLAYVDTPLEIGEGQTISAPHMVAMMCEALQLKEGHIILEIGTGSGYHAAVVAQIVGDKGHVYSVERFKVLADKAKNNLRKIGVDNVTVVVGDGSLGLKKYVPYDRIYITCAAPSIPPPLMNQLKDSGKLLLPVGQFFCRLVLVEKNGKQLNQTDLGGCAFVPLVGKWGHSL